MGKAALAMVKIREQGQGPLAVTHSCVHKRISGILRSDRRI